MGRGLQAPEARDQYSRAAWPFVVMSVCPKYIQEKEEVKGAGTDDLLCAGTGLVTFTMYRLFEPSPCAHRAEHLLFFCFLNLHSDECLRVANEREA